MASPRKSAVQVKARELARERAAAHLRRQDTLLDLAETFYAKQAERDSLAQREEARIAAIRAQTAAESERITAAMADAVSAMVATGEPVAGVAERLGIKPKEVRALADAATAKPAPRKDADIPTGDDGDAQDEPAESDRQGEGSWSTQEHPAVPGDDHGHRDDYAAQNDNAGSFGREPAPVG